MNDSITLKQLIERIERFLKFLLSKWLLILTGAVLTAGLLIIYHSVKKPTFTARTSFVLDNESSGGLGQLSSLASLAGVNVGGLAEGGTLFQIDNIQELYRSRRMIEKTLLSISQIDSYDLLIDHYIVVEELEKKWRRKFDKEHLIFTKPRDKFSRTQDSLLMEVTDRIQKKNLIVSKPSRKLTILEVAVNHRNEVFAKEFDQVLVKNVNEFYIETRTKKARENLNLLQSQTDSVKRVLDTKMLELAQATERLPNANPLYVTNQVPIQKLNIDFRTSTTVYAEMVKNLELAKISLRNTTPLIQIIDEPILPLEDVSWSLFKTVIIGGLIGGVFMVIYMSLYSFYRAALLSESNPL